MHAPYPGQRVITEDDRGPVANLGAWLSMCCMIMCVASKIITKGLAVGRLQRDDLFISLTMLFGCVQVVTVSMQVKYGLGRRLSDVTDIFKLQQSTLASEVFYIVTLGLAQISILAYMSFLSHDLRHRSSARYLSILSVLWTVVSFLSVVFQCRPPIVAAVFGGQCFDQVTFWTVWTIIGAVIDIAIGLLPVFILHRLHIRRSVRAAILTAFAARIWALPVAVVRLVYIYRTRGGDDLSYSMLDVTLLTTVHMNASIILTCVPFLKTVFDSLQSGIWGGDLRSGSISQAFSALKPNTHSQLASDGSVKRRPNVLKARSSQSRKETSSFTAHIEMGKVAESKGRQHSESTDSANPMIINQTTTITVERGSVGGSRRSDSSDTEVEHTK